MDDLSILGSVGANSPGPGPVRSVRCWNLPGGLPLNSGSWDSQMLGIALGFGVWQLCDTASVSSHIDYLKTIKGCIGWARVLPCFILLLVKINPAAKCGWTCGQEDLSRGLMVMDHSSCHTRKGIVCVSGYKHADECYGKQLVLWAS